MGDRILIVGGSGYFGSRLAESLSHDAETVITQRSVTPARTSWIERTRLQAIKFDSSRQSVLPVDGHFNAIINLAMPSVAEVTRDPNESRISAIATSKACLQVLDDGCADRVLHFSTFHVYGSASRVRYAEDDAATPTHPYGTIHLECERLMLKAAQTLVVRPSNMVGAPAHRDLGDQAKLFFVDLCRQAAAGAMRLSNDGKSYRDFLPFDDAIAAVRLLLKVEMNGDQLLNLASGEAQRLDTVAHLIQQVANNRPSLEFGTGQDACRQPFVISTDRLHRLGWQPRSSLADETRRAVNFFG